MMMIVVDVDIWYDKDGWEWYVMILIDNVDSDDYDVIVMMIVIVMMSYFVVD